jgi:hypothetical protein
MKFANYDLAELTLCGQEFEHYFRTAPLRGNPDWTSAVLDWFREKAGTDIRVYPPINKRREFIVDQCHTTYPVELSDELWPSVKWYDRAMLSPCGMKLVMESEWGKWGYADQSLVMVLDDACKLAVLRANVKVVVFASHEKDSNDRVVGMLQKLRKSHADPSPWLCLDVVNDATEKLPRDIRSRQLVD